jgi:hypothetical protein
MEIFFERLINLKINLSMFKMVIQFIILEVNRKCLLVLTTK